MSVSIEISVGDFLDKLSILKIKLEKIESKEKRYNIKKEYDLYQNLLRESKFFDENIGEFLGRLREVNLALWEIEDSIRSKESKHEFDEEFINLARSVYKTNDQRAEIKRQANKQYHSGLVEEKSYKTY